MGQDRSDTSKKQSCSASALLNNMPAMVFAKDAESGRYSSCNQSFAAYAHKSSPEGVVGLTDHEIFDRTTADHFVADDKKALTLDEPYVFIEDVPDAKARMHATRKITAGSMLYRKFEAPIITFCT